MRTNRRSTRLAALVAAGMLYGLAGCGGQEEPGEGEVTGTSQHELNQPNGWAKWPTSTVPVCWKTSTFQDASLDTFRYNVRVWVLNAISRVANIQFVGWGECPTTANNRLTLWVDKTYGNSGNGGGGAGWQGTGAPTKLQLGRDALDATNGSGVVIHEFMHRIGFGHEFNRPNQPGNDCAVKQEVEDGNAYGTPYDHGSIMNDSYCGYWNTLSAWDIVGLQNAYGRRPAGTIIGGAANCLDIPSTNTGAGSALQYYHCHGGSNQLWRRDTSNHLFSPSYSNSYVDVRTGTIADQAIVQMYYKNSPASVNQQWRFDNVQVKAIGGKCVDVPSGNFADQQQLQIYTCHGGNNQKWKVSADGVISHGNYCWDVPGGTAVSGAAVQLYTCHGGANQKFTLSSKGEIKFGGLCVDVRGGTPDDQSPLQLYSCKSDSNSSRQNQRFHLSGPIEVGSGYCLDVPGGDINDQVGAQVYTCHGGANQNWDYYFGY